MYFDIDLDIWGNLYLISFENEVEIWLKSVKLLTSDPNFSPRDQKKKKCIHSCRLVFSDLQM